MTGYTLSFDLMTVFSFMISVGTVCLTMGTYLSTVRKHEKQIEDLRAGKSPFDAAINTQVEAMQTHITRLMSDGSNKTINLTQRVDTLERHFEELDKKFDDLKAGQVRIETMLTQLIQMPKA